MKITNWLFNQLSEQVNCSSRLHSDPEQWRLSRNYLEQQIRTLRVQLDEMKIIRKHLRTIRPLVGKTESFIAIGDHSKAKTQHNHRPFFQGLAYQIIYYPGRFINSDPVERESISLSILFPAPRRSDFLVLLANSLISEFSFVIKDLEDYPRLVMPLRWIRRQRPHRLSLRSIRWRSTHPTALALPAGGESTRSSRNPTDPEWLKLSPMKTARSSKLGDISELRQLILVKTKSLSLVRLLRYLRP